MASTIEQAITSVEQHGSGTIYNSANDQAFSNTQLVCGTLLICMVLYITYRLIDGVITKTCLGCKRLKKCETRLNKLEGRR